MQRRGKKYVFLNAASADFSAPHSYFSLFVIGNSSSAASEREFALK
jgi:hypothetical protein